jgi:hypothetical protein
LAAKCAVELDRAFYIETRPSPLNGMRSSVQD